MTSEKTTRPWGSMRGTRYTTTATLAILLSGCGGGAVEEPESRTEMLAIAQTTNKWPSGTVPVCWVSSTISRPNFAAESFQVRSKAVGAWSTVSQVNFTGWGPCTFFPSSDRVSIELTNLSTSSIGGVGRGRYNLTLGVGSASDGPPTAVIARQFGHVLGYMLEQQRPDFPDHPNCALNNVAFPNTLETPPDPESIMGPGAACGGIQNLNNWDALGSKIAYGKRVSGVSVLTTSFHSGRGDFATVATDAGRAQTLQEGYARSFADGWIFDFQAPTTVPLKLFWHQGRGDLLAVATKDGQDSAAEAGYQFVRNEGFVYPSQQSGTVPLKLFWHSGRQDNLTTASPAGEAAALAAGYGFARVEGYVFKDRPYNVLFRYYHSGRGDHLTVGHEGHSPVARLAARDGYVPAGLDIAVMRDALPGTRRVKSWFNSQRGDFFTTASTAGEQSAIEAGYDFFDTEGFAFTANGPGLVPLTSLWHNERQDNATSGFPGDVTFSGYQIVRTEAFGLPIAGNRN